MFSLSTFLRISWSCSLIFFAIERALCYSPFWSHHWEADCLESIYFDNQASKISIIEKWSDLRFLNLSFVRSWLLSRFSSCFDIPTQICSVERTPSNLDISRLQSRDSKWEATRAFANVGSSGIRERHSPNALSLPSRSITSRRNSYFRACRRASSSGLSKNSKLRTSVIYIDLRVKTVQERFTLLISGKVWLGIYFSKKSRVYRRIHFPVLVLPAQPER